MSLNLLAQINVYGEKVKRAGKIKWPCRLGRAITNESKEVRGKRKG